MKNIFTKINDKALSALVGMQTKLAVTTTVAGASILDFGVANAAATGTSAGQIFQGLSRQAQSAANLFVNGAFIGGLIMAGSGVYDLKKSGDSENRGQVSPKSGAIKVLCGGGLAAIAPITGIGVGTIFNGTAGVSPTITQATGFQTG